MLIGHTILKPVGGHLHSVRAADIQLPLKKNKMKQT